MKNNAPIIIFFIPFILAVIFYDFVIKLPYADGFGAWGYIVAIWIFLYWIQTKYFQNETLENENNIQEKPSYQKQEGYIEQKTMNVFDSEKAFKYCTYSFIGFSIVGVAEFIFFLSEGNFPGYSLSYFFSGLEANTELKGLNKILNWFIDLSLLIYFGVGCVILFVLAGIKQADERR